MAPRTLESLDRDIRKFRLEEVANHISLPYSRIIDSGNAELGGGTIGITGRDTASAAPLRIAPNDSLQRYRSSAVNIIGPYRTIKRQLRYQSVKGANNHAYFYIHTGTHP